MQVRNFIWIALWVCFTTLSIAQPENNFDKANIEYRNGNYAEAAKAYEAILDNGKHSADLYFNLGNAYYKLSKLGPSVYYYEKGLQLDPNNKDILNNLNHAEQVTVDEIVPEQVDGVNQFFKNIIQGFSSNTWAILAIASSILAAGLFLLYYFTRKPSLQRVWFISSLFFMLGVLFTISMSYAALKLANTNYAIVWEEEIEVRDGPTRNSSRIYYLHEGTKVSITYEEDNWARIILADGNEGWVQKQEIKKL